MLKGLCAYPRCKKNSEWILYYNIESPVGGTTQKSKSIVGCFCNQHAESELERAQQKRGNIAEIKEIDSLNYTKIQNNNLKGKNEQ